MPKYIFTEIKNNSRFFIHNIFFREWYKTWKHVLDQGCHCLGGKKITPLNWKVWESFSLGNVSGKRTKTRLRHEEMGTNHWNNYCNNIKSYSLDYLPVRQKTETKFCMCLEILSGLPVLRHSRGHVRSQCFCSDGVTELFWQLTLCRWGESECNRQTGRNIFKVVVFQVSKMFPMMWVQQKSDLSFLLEKWTFADWAFFFLDELWVVWTVFINQSVLNHQCSHGGRTGWLSAN